MILGAPDDDDFFRPRRPITNPRKPIAIPPTGPMTAPAIQALLDGEDVEEGAVFKEPSLFKGVEVEDEGEGAGSDEVAGGMLKEEPVGGGGEEEESLVDVAAAGEISVNTDTSHYLIVLMLCRDVGKLGMHSTYHGM